METHHTDTEDRWQGGSPASPLDAASHRVDPRDTRLAAEAPVGQARTTSRLLAAGGFQPAEAGNLTAYLYGLKPVEGGWTADEIERLLFVRYLVERRRITS
jgi:hypothetical protein